MEFRRYEDEILVFSLGKHSAKAVANLLIKLKQLNIEYFLIDNREAFKVVRPANRYLSGKK